MINFNEVRTIDLINDWSHAKLAKVALQLQERTAANNPRMEDHPILPNIDYFGDTTPYEACIGGDHLGFVNFQDYHIEDDVTIQDLAKAAREEGRIEYAAKLEKNLDAVGILILDSAGHSIGDSVPITYFRGAFQMAIDYMLLMDGEITADFFRRFNRKYHKWLEPDFITEKPYMTLSYAEIHNTGVIRSLYAGHPPPMIFSDGLNRFVLLDDEYTKSTTPLGVMPKEYYANTDRFQQSNGFRQKYPVNEIMLTQGDIMLLYTDGLIEHTNGKDNFCESHLEKILKDSKQGTAEQIYKTIMSEMHKYCPPKDDVTLVVVKKI